MTGPVTRCQACGRADLESVYWHGFLPPVNTFRKIGSPAVVEARWPAELLVCRTCTLVQMGFVPSPEEVFPPTYSYRSGTTKALRDNFADLVSEIKGFQYAIDCDLVCDIGCNDGTLLTEFDQNNFDPFGIEPTDAADDASAKGLCVFKMSFPTTDGRLWYDLQFARNRAKVVTACNVFAHTPDPNQFIEGVKTILADDGVFVIEVQYLPDLQPDTIYHEHLRYYSLTSLSALLERHGMRVIRHKRIPTHGGSIRVYAAREGAYPPAAWGESIPPIREWQKRFDKTRRDIIKTVLLAKQTGGRIYGVGCPSRAVSLIHWCNLECFIDCICELPNSPKVGCHVPGTRLEVVDEKKLIEDQPEFVLLLSWHLGDDLIENLRAKGFRGDFILPLPEPRVL